MSHRPSRSVLIPGLLIFLVLGFTRGGESARVLATEASLRAGPGSASLSGLLTAGTPVVVLAERDGWMQVRIEGWVPANSLAPAPAVAVTSPAATASITQTAAASAPAAAAPEPAGSAAAAVTHPPGATDAAGDSMAPDAQVPTTAATTTAPATTPSPAAVAASTVPATTLAALARIEGSIAVEIPGFFKRKQNTTGSGVLVLLLPDAFEFDPSVDDQILALDAEAAELKRKADKAMRAPSLSTATKERDRYLGERSDILDRRWDYMMQIHGRNEARARAAAVQTAVADSAGWYTFASVPPGSYTLYARWIKEEMDLEWIAPVAVEQTPVRIDLDETSAIGFPAK